MERPDRSESGDEQAEQTNELGYRNVDEERAYDERGGTQGPGPSEPTERDDDMD